MQVKDLIEALKELDPQQEIMILDGFNGGGTPRTINIGPISHKIIAQEAEEAGDCEDLLGQTVYVIGYGCY